MRIVTRAELAQFVSHEAAYEAVFSALQVLAAGQVAAPDEIALHMAPKGEVHVKGAHIAGSRWIVFKVASGSFPNVPAAGCSLILSAETGAPVALFDDGGWLTDMRTAAAGAIAADALAVEGPLRVAILGTGAQARFQLEALRSRRDITATHFWGRDYDKAVALADEAQGIAVTTVNEAVEDANLIVTTTSATSPILSAVDIAPGTHITAMGSDTVGKRELAADVLDAAKIIAADDVGICTRVGELQHAPGHVARAMELSRAVADGVIRSGEADITVADLCGIGTYDAAIAGLVADQLL